MKKNVVFVSLAAFASILFASCGSTKIAIQEHSPVAVFSIIGNSQVPWVADNPNDPDESDPDGLLSSMVNKLIDGDNPEIVTAVDRLDYAGDSFAQILSEMTGCEVLPKADVIKSDAYNDLGGSYFNLLAATKSATEYKDLTGLGSKKARIAMKGVGANSAVILNFTFQKKLLKGNKWNGELCGLVILKARMLNSRGKEIINKSYNAQTSQRIKITSHKYDKNAFVASLNDGIDSVIRQFALEFVGADDDTNAEALLEDGTQAQTIALPVRPKDSAETVPAEPAKTEEAAQ